MSITQGGNGFPHLADAFYQYMAKGVYTNITVDTADVPGAVLKYAVQKVPELIVVYP